MAKYHNIKINGMGYEEYAYDYIVNRGNADIDDIELELSCKFGTPESTGLALARNILSNTNGRRDEIAQSIKAAQIAAMPWQEQPATAPQIKYVSDLGLNTVPNGLTKLQASKLIDGLKEQRDNELDDGAIALVASLLG